MLYKQRKAMLFSVLDTSRGSFGVEYFRRRPLYCMGIWHVTHSLPSERKLTKIARARAALQSREQRFQKLAFQFESIRTR